MTLPAGTLTSPVWWAAAVTTSSVTHPRHRSPLACPTRYAKAPRPNVSSATTTTVDPAGNKDAPPGSRPPPAADPARRSRRRLATVLGLAAAVASVTTLIIRLTYHGSATIETGSPSDTAVPSGLAQALMPPQPAVTYSVPPISANPAVTPPAPVTAGLCPTSAQDRTDSQGAVAQVIGTFACAVNDGDYTESGGLPDDATSRYSFDTLTEESGQDPDSITITNAHADNATTLRVDTQITNGSLCWTMTLMLSRDTAGDYVITSIDPPADATCS